jgi:hypothetical protein
MSIELDTLLYRPKGTQNNTLLLEGFFTKAFYTKLNKINRFKAILALNNQSFIYTITKEDIFA